MGSLIWNSLWLIAVDPHRAGPFHYDLRGVFLAIASQLNDALV
jgi:hypothetical protein